MVENGEKVRKKKKRRKKHYFLRFLIFIAVIAGLIYFLNSSVFDLQEITVEGNTYFTSEQVIERSGMTTGVNVIFGVDKKDIKKELLKDPYVKNVNVRKNYPNKVTLELEERIEAAAVPFTKEYIITDAEGLVLRTTEVEPKLPILVGLTVKNMEAGKALEVEENAIFSGTLSMIGAMQNSEVYFKKVDISKVVVKAYVYDSLVCQGMPEDIKNAIQNGTLQSLLFELYSKGVEVGTITVTADSSNMAYNPLVE